MTHPHTGVREALAELVAAHDTMPTTDAAVVARARAALAAARAALAATQAPQAEAPAAARLSSAMPCANQYAGKRAMAVTREWVRGWDACCDHLRELEGAAQATPLSVEPVARKAFEQAMAGKLDFEPAGLLRKAEGSTYWQPETETCWRAWQLMTIASPPPVAESADALDARRYRWLRVNTYNLDIFPEGRDFGEMWTLNENHSEAEFDTAIDAAIAAAPAGGEPT